MNWKIIMRKIKDFKKIKAGDWILVRKPPYLKKDKRHAIIVVEKRFISTWDRNLGCWRFCRERP